MTHGTANALVRNGSHSLSPCRALRPHKSLRETSKDTDVLRGQAPDVAHRLSGICNLLDFEGLKETANTHSAPQISRCRHCRAATIQCLFASRVWASTVLKVKHSTRHAQLLPYRHEEDSNSRGAPSSGDATKSNLLEDGTDTGNSLLRLILLL